LTKKKNALTRLWGWVKDEFIQDVPEETAICAFDCAKEQCTREEWEACDRRLQKGAGQLMPADEVATQEPARTVLTDAAADEDESAEKLRA
jgi:hypothetical protein